MNPAQPLHTPRARASQPAQSTTIEQQDLLHRVSHVATIALIACFSLFLVMLIVFSVYGMTHANNAYAGVSIAGIDVSGKSENEINTLIDQQLHEYEQQPVTLIARDQQFTSSLSELGISIDRDATIQRAMAFGRSGSWWDRSVDWAKGLLEPQDFAPVVVVDAPTFQARMYSIAPDVVALPQNAYVQIQGAGQPSLVADIPGTSINVAATRSLLMDHVQHLETKPVSMSLISVPAAVNAKAIEAGLPNAQRAVSSTIQLQSDEGKWPVEPDQLKNLVWVDDDGQLNVHDEQARSVVETVAAEINHPAQDANITVDENGNFVVVPAVFSAEVDIEASAAALEKSLTAGSTDVPLVVDRKAPQITDEMAAEWADKADKLAGQGVTVLWDEESAPISRAELIWAMVIEPRPGEDEPFRLSFDRSVLTEQLQPIADSIYQEPQDIQLRLIDGEIKQHAAAVEGRQVDMEKSVSAIDKAARDGSFQAKLKIDEIDPKYTTADVNDINLDDVLGDSSTWYGDSSDPRRHNVERAVELENGWLVPPGGEFSYAQVMGLVTAENGFVTGFGIVADPSGGVTTAPVIGGGICQVSTTIFQAAFWAGMEITERYQHPYWLLNYGEPPRGMKGLDAMVNIEPDWSLDLKFRNSTANWIAVVMTADGETVGAKIVGVDQGWTVQVDDPVLTNVVKSDPNKMIYTDSPELPKGQELQVEYAKDGFDASIKRTVRDSDGNIVSTYTLESSYAASRNTTLRGTGTENMADTGN